MRRRGTRKWASERGQASIEVVALAPVIVAICLLIAALFGSYKAHEAAAFAAHAAGVAALQGSDPKQAAKDAIPEVKASRIKVKVSKRWVAVKVKARGPLEGISFLDGDETVSLTASGGN